MKQKSFLTKILAVLLAAAFFTASPAHIVALATGNSQSDEYAGMTAEEKQAAIEQKIKELDSKLSSLGKESKETEEYINALDEKISYLKKQLEYSENKIDSSKKKINDLQQQYKDNEAQIAELTTDVANLEVKNAQLEQTFSQSLTLYYQRIRAIYVSGETSTIAMLLTSPDISTLLTRYEMIKTVSKSDSALLKEVNSKMAEVTNKKNGLADKKAAYDKKKSELDSQKKQLSSKQKSIEQNSNSIANKKASLATDRAESDKLLAELTAQNKQYTEFRNEDSSLIEQVENEIQAVISGVKPPEEATTAVAGKNSSKIDKIDQKGSDVYSKSNAVLNMTYPVPGHHGVSAGFPNYSSGKYHGGIDFPCSTGSKVVAAQKGIVITVKRLNYSYGYYVMIYHGTDAQGRSVVTLYAHNSRILVSPGQTVKKGEAIAKSGSTGNSTGPHSHFEVRLNGSRVNPKNYLS